MTIFDYAKYYFSLGLKVTCIKAEYNLQNYVNRNVLKVPYHPWSDYTHRTQELSDLNELDWDNACGLGTVAGCDSIMAIDLDGCTNVVVLEKMLRCLGLPSNYEWVTISGSQVGFHIIARCQMFSHLEANQVVCTYPPKPLFADEFDKLELLWRTHIVLPPSLHVSGNHYVFRNDRLPNSSPSRIELPKLNSMIQEFAEVDEVVVGSRYGHESEEVKSVQTRFEIDTVGELNLLNQSYFCVLDIETDGLPQRSSSGIQYPNILQISWAIMNPSLQVVKRNGFLVRNENLKHNNAFHINRIDVEITNKIGVPIDKALDILAKDLYVCDYMVAHNMEFDFSIIKYYADLCGIGARFNRLGKVCTMISGLQFLQDTDSPTTERNYPKLSELFTALFGLPPIELHNASSDVFITAKCFKELVNRSYIRVEPKAIGQSTVKRLSGFKCMYPSVIVVNGLRWMNDNLKVEKFRNGDPIPLAQSAELWSTAAAAETPARCILLDQSTGTYEVLYNWWAVTDVRGINPKGWHVPDTSKLMRLGMGLEGSDFFSTQMFRRSSNGEFSKQHSIITLWSTESELDEGCALNIHKSVDDEGDFGGFWSETFWPEMRYDKGFGFPVRLFQANAQ
jgi:uncharacterized protein (TIGR02145 family)